MSDILGDWLQEKRQSTAKRKKNLQILSKWTDFVSRTCASVDYRLRRHGTSKT